MMTGCSLLAAPPTTDHLFAVVVVNASDSNRVTSSGDDRIQLPAYLQTAGKVLRPVLTIGQEKAASNKVFDASGPLRLPVPAFSSLVVYEAVDAP